MGTAREGFPDVFRHVASARANRRPRPSGTRNKNPFNIIRDGARCVFRPDYGCALLAEIPTTRRFYISSELVYNVHPATFMMRTSGDGMRFLRFLRYTRSACRVDETTAAAAAMETATNGRTPGRARFPSTRRMV